MTRVSLELQLADLWQVAEYPTNLVENLCVHLLQGLETVFLAKSQLLGQSATWQLPVDSHSDESWHVSGLSLSQQLVLKLFIY